jgi:hypothetical protein
MNFALVTDLPELVSRPKFCQCPMPDCRAEQSSLPICVVHAAAIPRRIVAGHRRLADASRSLTGEELQPVADELASQAWDIVARAFRATIKAASN